MSPLSRFRILSPRRVGAILALAMFAAGLIPAAALACPNEAARTGRSADLPDCRAYELVTPPTNGAIPEAIGNAVSPQGSNFRSWRVAASGEGVVFGTSGLIPGFEGNGVQNRYQSSRGPDGWMTVSDGPTGSQSEAPGVGGNSPDLGYTFWNAGALKASNHGSLVTADNATWVHSPAGTFEPIGLGSLGVDSQAAGRWITDGGEHIIFTSDLRIEPDAPSEVGPGEEREFMSTYSLEPVDAVYDRAVGGQTRVVSLLPGDVTPPSGSTTYYQGSSADGSAVFFSVDETLYERREGKTLPMVTGGGPEGPLFVGSSENGSKAFYMEIGNPAISVKAALQGDIFAFDAETGNSVQITSGDDAYLVNISADGSHVYFASPALLDGSKGVAGEPNLYIWNGTSIAYIATLSDGDFESPEGEAFNNLGYWPIAATSFTFRAPGPGADPSRSTPDGSVFVFQSKAGLTPEATVGKKAIFRFSEGTPTLECISCKQGGPPPSGDAELVQWDEPAANLPPTGPDTIVESLTADGEATFFVTKEALLPADVNHVSDVYEWHNGALSLISSGTGETPNFLYGVTPSGHDVFFITYDSLSWQDTDNGGPSIYDAKVDGGFVEPLAISPCEPLSGSCQAGSPTIGPALGPATTATFQGPGNPKRHIKGGPKPPHKPRRHHRKKRHHRKRHRAHGGHKQHSKHRASSHKGGSR
jgi:hypothetical protein